MLGAHLESWHGGTGATDQRYRFIGRNRGNAYLDSASPQTYGETRLRGLASAFARFGSNDRCWRDRSSSRKIGRHRSHFLYLDRITRLRIHPGSNGIPARTHHSNMDLYDRVQPGDLMQASAITAWFVYSTATRAEMMPRLDPPPPIKQASTVSSPTIWQLRFAHFFCDLATPNPQPGCTS